MTLDHFTQTQSAYHRRSFVPFMKTFIFERLSDSLPELPRGLNAQWARSAVMVIQPERRGWLSHKNDFTGT